MTGVVVLKCSLIQLMGSVMLMTVFALSFLSLASIFVPTVL